MNIREFRRYASEQLYFLDVSEREQEIKILLEEYLNLSFTQILINSQAEISEGKLEMLFKAVELRKKGVPLQYILGHWDFMGLKLAVGEGVLIPREDTATMVEMVVSKIENKHCVVADLCAGTGCISFVLENILKNNLEIYAIELSDLAYRYLSQNKNNLKSKVNILQADIFKICSKFEDDFFDVVVSNPPYIKTEDINFLEREVLYEPRLALDGGETGLYFYENICKLWIPKIKSSGILAFEIGQGQHDEVKSLMINHGMSNVEFKKDINGIIRCVVGIKI